MARRRELCLTKETTMRFQQNLDQEKARAFLGQVFGDLTGLTNTVLASIGDRLGLFKDLAANGPATSQALAARTGVDERYAREWLRGMASASYLTYDADSGRFTLPPEHALTLADEGGRSSSAVCNRKCSAHWRLLIE
jgi:hypothetical protein